MAQGSDPGSSGSTGTPKAHASVHTGRVIYIAAIAALGGFLFGYDSSVINGANKAVFYEFQITSETLQGFTVAIALLGSAAGAFIGGQLTDRYGRKKVMVTAAILFLAAGIGQALPFALWDFMFWRLLGGFAIGLAAVVSPMYITEIAPAHLRGRLSSLFQLAIVTGIFATQVINQIIINIVPDTPPAAAPGSDPSLEPVSANNELALGLDAWQWMFLCMIVPAIIFWVLSLTLPESPRYLVAKDRDEEARATLEQIYDEDVTGRLEKIEESLAGEHKMRLSDIKGRSFGLKPIVWIGIILAALQQLAGINAVFYYSNLIWTAVGFAETEAFLTSTIISVVNVIFTLVAIALIDRVGRRPLLLIGSVGMFVTLGILTIVFQSAPACTEAIINAGGQNGCNIAADVGNPLLEGSSATMAVVMLNMYVAFFAATWGPIIWVLLGEMFPNKIRAAAMSVGVMANWLANFLVSEFFPTLASLSLGLAYGIFTSFALVSFFYVLKYVKETKGVTLEDMDTLEKSEL